MTPRSELEAGIDIKIAELEARQIKYRVAQTAATVGLVVALGGLMLRFVR